MKQFFLRSNPSDVTCRLYDLRSNVRPTSKTKKKPADGALRDVVRIFYEDVPVLQNVTRFLLYMPNSNFIYARKESVTSFLPKFHETHKRSTDLCPDLLCRISNRSVSGRGKSSNCICNVPTKFTFTIK
jgi:hypothetical protein